MIESKIEYMKIRVPELIMGGNDIGASTAMASSEWEENQAAAFLPVRASEDIEVSCECSIEFTAEVTDGGFKGILQEEALFADKTFAEIFAMLKCEPGKRYEIEISVEEAF